MGSDDQGLSRRDFLLGPFRNRRPDAADSEAASVDKSSEQPPQKGDEEWGWQPDWQPLTEEELEQNRREARRQLGQLDEPQDEQPFDALEFLAGLDGGSEEEGDQEGDQE